MELQLSCLFRKFGDIFRVNEKIKKIICLLLIGFFGFACSNSDNNSSKKALDSQKENELAEIKQKLATSKNEAKLYELYKQLRSDPRITIDMLVRNISDSRKSLPCNWSISDCTVGYYFFRAAYARLVFPLKEPRKESFHDFVEIDSEVKLQKFWNKNKSKNLKQIKIILFVSAIRNLQKQIEKRPDSKISKRLAKIKKEYSLLKK